MKPIDHRGDMREFIIHKYATAAAFEETPRKQESQLEDKNKIFEADDKMLEAARTSKQGGSRTAEPKRAVDLLADLFDYPSSDLCEVVGTWG